MEMPEINNRVLKLIEYYTNRSVKKFAESINIPQQTVNRLFNKDTRTGKFPVATTEILVAITRMYVDVDANWLMTGAGNMFKTSPAPLQKDNQTTVAIGTRSDKNDGIPLIPIDAMAGMLSGDDHTIMEYECEYYVIPMFKGAEFLIQVKGDSMRPQYYSGDIVACKRLPLDTFFQWNRTYVIDSEQGVLIKKIEKGSDDAHITLVSENKEYKPFEIAKEKIYSLALVIGVVRAE